MDQVLCEFIAESWESLNQLDADIVELEKRNGDPELLASVFRTIHTIKGTCGFIGLTRLGVLAHSTENVLGQMREGKLEPSSDAFSITLRAIDEIKALLTSIEATGQEPERDHASLIHQLGMLAELADDSPSTVVGSADPEQSSVDELSHEPSDDSSNSTSQTTTSEPGSSDLNAVGAEANQPEASVESASACAVPSPATSVEATVSGGRSVSDLSIRVNVDMIDNLINLVSELVLTRNQLLQLVRGDEESKYVATIARLNRVTTDLQEGVMKTRIQPIGSACAKMPRLVRDLCQVTGKQIEREMQGAEPELDRTVLDAVDARR